MISPISSSLSGLAAASKRLEVSASNVANISSTKTLEDGVLKDEPYNAQQVLQISQPEGGVDVIVRNANPPTVAVFDPGNPDAGTNGAVEYPNVSLERELVDQKVATYDFKANLKALKAADEAEQSLLDILS